MFAFIERLILFMIAISVIRSVIRFVQRIMGSRSVLTSRVRERTIRAGAPQPRRCCNRTRYAALMWRSTLR